MDTLPVISSEVEKSLDCLLGSLHSGRDDKPQSSPAHNDPAEVKASSPIRTSLFEREGSMWGSLKRPSLRRSPIVIPSPLPSVIPSGAEGSQGSLHALRLVEMTGHALRLVEMTREGRPRDLFPYTFKALSEELNLPPEGRSMVDNCRADDSELCLETISNGWLTDDQMRHAAERYRLGKSRLGKTIYWMIDERGICHDGHVGNTWISEILKRRYPETAKYIRPTHCLFGLHLATNVKMQKCQNVKIAIVESERSAVILSELYPQTIWLASVYPANFTIDQLEPLQGCKVTLFPRTDPVMDHYVAWLEIADQARRLYHLDITVSSLLEDHATPEQKAQGIDLLEFLFTNHL